VSTSTGAVTPVSGRPSCTTSTWALCATSLVWVLIHPRKGRLHEVGPQLQYGPLPMKDVLSDLVQKQRVDNGRDMLYRLQGQPDSH